MQPRLDAIHSSVQTLGMPLEDHAGDVIAKSRKMKSIDVEVVAEAAGLSVSQLAEYEDQGVLKRELNWVAVAELLALDAEKLERVARGWVPKVPDLSAWGCFRQITTTGPTMDVHAYLVWDENSREAAIIDTGFDPGPIFEIIESENLTTRFLLITHMHGDHVAGLQGIRERFPNIAIRTDAESAPESSRNQRDEVIELGDLRITNRDTPGHAVDGVTYVVEGFSGGGGQIAIVGDAIFAGSMGGAPTAGSLAKQKVRDQILTLPETTLLCPGHGPLTTVGEEKANNPFF